MSKRSDRLLLQDILGSIEKITVYITHMDYEAFEEDSRTVDAVIRNLEIIGEAAIRLSPELKTVNPGIEWRKIAGLRHRIVHAYFGVDLAIVWQILGHDIPKLRKELEEILKNIKEL